MLHDTRRWQSKPHLSVSLERLRSILTYLARVKIGMYRLSSALVPYGTHPDLPEFHGQLEDCADSSRSWAPTRTSSACASRAIPASTSC